MNVLRIVVAALVGAGFSLLIGFAVALDPRIPE